MLFLSIVIRDNLLLSSKAHEWRRNFDEMQGNPTLTTRREAMNSMQASVLSGGTTGMFLTCAICKSSPDIKRKSNVTQAFSE